MTTASSKSSDAVICTDSQSLVLSIENRRANVSDISEKLQQLKGRVIIQWIPAGRGHSDIPGNELANKIYAEIAQNGEVAVSPPLSNTARSSRGRFKAFNRIQSKWTPVN